MTAVDSKRQNVYSADTPFLEHFNLKSITSALEKSQPNLIATITASAAQLIV